MSETLGNTPVNLDADFKPVIEDNFHTSGPNIGRTKDTELAVDMAKAQDEEREDSDLFLSASETNLSNGRVLAHNDPEVQQAEKAVQEFDARHPELDEDGMATWTSKPELITEANKLDEGLDAASEAVFGEVDRLQAKKEAHDAELLARARDQEVDAQEAAGK